MSESPSLSLLDQLLLRLQERESLELEFKAARGGLPNDVWPTVSAFANTQGGWLLLGVDEKAAPPIVGVTNPEKMLQQLNTTTTGLTSGYHGGDWVRLGVGRWTRQTWIEWRIGSRR